MPLLSVVVPTHNRAARLEVAITSALRQTLDDFEIVIVDDGSSDETPAVLEKLEGLDRRITSLRLSPGGGAARARNAGLAKASGDYIAFLDDDDEWAPHKLESQVAYLRAHPDVGLVSCNFHLVRDGRADYHRGPERFPAVAMLWVNVMMGASFAMLHRPSFSFDPSFDERLVPAEDWDLWFRCSLERGVAIVPESLARYVRHGVQLTSSVDRQQRGDGAFFSKHEAMMSANARAFHRAHLWIQGAEGSGGRMRARMRIFRDMPPAIGLLYTKLALGRRIGSRRGDPAWPVRILTHAVERLE